MVLIRRVCWWCWIDVGIAEPQGRRCLRWSSASLGCWCPWREKRCDSVWKACCMVENHNTEWKSSSLSSKAVIAGFCVFSQSIQWSHLQYKIKQIIRGKFFCWYNMWLFFWRRLTYRGFPRPPLEWLPLEPHSLYGVLDSHWFLSDIPATEKSAITTTYHVFLITEVCFEH